MQILNRVFLGFLLLAVSSSVHALPSYLVVDDVVDQIKAAAVPILSIGIAALTVLAVVAMVRWARGAM